MIARRIEKAAEKHTLTIRALNRSTGEQASQVKGRVARYQYNFSDI
jgi:hypothetical protein